MGQNWISASKSRGTPAEISDCIQEGQQLPQGPIDIEVHPSSLPGMHFTDINVGEGLHPVIQNHPNASAGKVSLNGDGNSLLNSDDNLKDVGVLLDLQRASKLPLSTDSHVQENSTFPAEILETGHLRGDMILERVTMEDCLDAHFQEALEFNGRLRTLLQQREDRIDEQEGLSLAKENEIANLKIENQQFRELITKQSSQVGQVMQMQARIREMKAEIKNLYEEVRSLPLVCDEYLNSSIGGAFAHFFCENRTLRQNLFNCQTELKSVKLSWTCEIKQMEDKMLRTEEVNRNLEQKAEKIQQQLCKERIGQDGSYVDGQQTPSLVESTAKEMFSCISTFCILLSKDTGPCGRNLINSFIVGTDLWKKSHLARKEHWRYLLKGYISGQLFANFESEGIVDSDKAVVFLDPEERVRKCFEYFQSCKTGGAVGRVFYHASNEKLDYLFFKYLTDTLSLLPADIKLKVWRIFQNHQDFTRVRLDDLLSGLAINKRNLVRSFILAAEKVWQFHKLCLSFEPPATIFRVPSGETFNQHYMESTDALETDNSKSVPTVAFMVYPGFRLRKSIIKCEVYVAV